MLSAIPETIIETPSIAEHIAEIYGVLTRETDLSPNNPRVNSLLGALVRFVTLAHDANESAQALAELERAGLVEPIRQLCQKAECLLEYHYSKLLAY